MFRTFLPLCHLRPTRGLLPGLMPARKALPALRDLCSLAPLCLPAPQFDDAHITAHSPHGSYADMACVSWALLEASEARKPPLASRQE